MTMTSAEHAARARTEGSIECEYTDVVCFERGPERATLFSIRTAHSYRLKQQQQKRKLAEKADQTLGATRRGGQGVSVVRSRVHGR